MITILLIGNQGQLGWELERTLAPLGNVVGVDFPEIDITSEKRVNEYVKGIAPNIIINAAAYTDVDGAEENMDTAFQVNTHGSEVLTLAAQQYGAALIHYSTDFVFDGKKGQPYNEDDETNPVNLYGASKLEGELAISRINVPYLIFRTSWVYSLRRPSFLSKTLKWIRAYEELRIVDDQFGSPTWARMLAETTALTIVSCGENPVRKIGALRGTYHLGGRGGVSRYEWAKKIVELDPDKSEHIVKSILPAKSYEFPTPAKRPAYSILDCTKFEKAFGISLPPWEHALELALRK